MKKINLLLFASFLLALTSCSSSDDATAETNANLIVKLKFDENQVRLDNLVNPSVIAQGNAAQTPVMNEMSAHYLELSPTANTLIGQGEVIYKGEETTKGGEKAIDFSKEIFVKDGEMFLKIPLKDIKKGNYEWLRISASYQNGKVKALYNGAEYDATLTSFLGYNTYIDNYTINGKNVVIKANKLQGYWGFEALGTVIDGQAPAGAITVPNPIYQTSPIPEGSCVLTGKFDKALAITGNETKDVTITISFSINNSFEWNEVNVDGKYEPTAGEIPVDMGLRGLKLAVD
ncbi:hypothetical protein [Flavobacterium fluviatile]|uniref:hypothetical protein n=1 Tax=Flavobacterium fluviatile TaxID=1862387 RepID=UPI0013D77EFE|nr:hypothetical protein [Flavobacterium fluviatile]